MPLWPTPSVLGSSLWSCVGQQILRAQVPWWALVWGRHMASVLNSLGGKRKSTEETSRVGGGRSCSPLSFPGLSLPWARPHHPANIPGECHPLACPLLLGAGAAATQGVPSHDAWVQDGEGEH